MAYTASYIMNGHYRNDQACFASIMKQGLTSTIVIEEFKTKLEGSVEFLEDVCEIYNLEMNLKGEHGIHIESPGNHHIALKKEYMTVIRFLWEGLYQPEGFNYDKFYKIVEHYLNLKKYYPAQNIYKLLTIAINIYLLGRPSINTNHFTSSSQNEYSKIFNTFKNKYKSSQLHSKFSTGIKIQDKDVLPKDYVFNRNGYSKLYHKILKIFK